MRTDLLLHVEPSNRQAQSLKGLIDAAETKEGYIGASPFRSPLGRHISLASYMIRINCSEDKAV